MAQLSKQPPVSRITYPWDVWLDGKSRDLKQGDDFPTTVSNLKAVAYQAAKRLGCKVIVNILDNTTLRLQAIKATAEKNGTPVKAKAKKPTKQKKARAS
jgi:hypothetical protein